MNLILDGDMMQNLDPYGHRSGNLSRESAKQLASEFASVPVTDIKLKNDRIQIVKHHKVIQQVSLKQFIKAVEFYSLQDVLGPRLYEYLKVEKDKQGQGNPSFWSEVISAGFDEYAGVKKTDAHATFEKEQNQGMQKQLLTKCHRISDLKLKKTTGQDEKVPDLHTHEVIQNQSKEKREKRKGDKSSEAKSQIRVHRAEEFEEMLAVFKNPSIENKKKFGDFFGIDSQYHDSLFLKLHNFDLLALYREISSFNELNQNQVSEFLLKYGLKDINQVLSSHVRELMSPEKLIYLIIIMSDNSRFLEDQTDFYSLESIFTDTSKFYSRLLSLSEIELNALMKWLDASGYHETFTSRYLNKLHVGIDLIKLGLPLDQLSSLTFDLVEYLSSYQFYWGFKENMYLSDGYKLNNQEMDYLKLLDRVSKPHGISWATFFFLASTSLQEESFVKEHSQVLGHEEIWKHYVVNRGSWAKKEYKIDQIEYGKMMHQGVLAGQAALEQGRWNFEQHLHFVEHHRASIAAALKQTGPGPAVSFGCGLYKMNHRMNTPCVAESSYPELGKKLTDAVAGWRNEPNPYFREGPGNHMLAKSELEYEFGHLKMEIKGKEVQLSTFQMKVGKVQSIIHPSFDIFPDVLTLVSEIYDKSLEEENPQELLKDLGKIYWLLCQAKPWIRGDPSIAEMLFKPIWRAKTGQDLPPWKEGVVPWEETMLTQDMNTFGDRFYELFQTNPFEVI